MMGMSHARGEHATPFSHAHHGFAHPPRNVAALGISPGMKVADFGSGSGAYVLAIAKELHGSGHVYAIDIQKDLLRRTKNEAEKQGHKNVEVLWGDLESPNGSKIADNALELVLISNLLFQIDDKRAVFAEAKRILRPSGRLAIIDWSESFGGLGPQKEDVVKKEQALTLARAVELTFLKEFSAGAHHYGLIFRKHAGKSG
jgi:ubiquinone/menaquinone biosynthesis C-methylase UbiE